MDRVPIYALYGESAAQGAVETLHCETIEARSRLYDFSIRPHRHERLFQTLYLAAGTACATCDGSRTILAPPCLVTVPAGVVHGFDFSNPVEGLVLTVYQHRVDAILGASSDALNALARPRVMPLAEGVTSAAASLAAIAEEFAGHAPHRVAMMEAQLAVLLLTAARLGRTDRDRAFATSSRGVEHVLRFRKLVDRDFASFRNTEHYARALGVTDVHLRRVCQLQLGTSPLGMVNARAALEARRLLQFTALSVKQVGAAVGFADDAYFSRFFRRETGQTPSAFRARQRTTAGPPAAPSRTPRAGTRLAADRPAGGKTG